MIIRILIVNSISRLKTFGLKAQFNLTLGLASGNMTGFFLCALKGQLTYSTKTVHHVQFHILSKTIDTPP